MNEEQHALDWSKLNNSRDWTKSLPIFELLSLRLMVINGRPTYNNQLITHYQCVRYFLLRIQQYPVNNTYNTDLDTYFLFLLSSVK